MYATEIETAIETLRAETYVNGGSTVSVIGKPAPAEGYLVGGEVTGWSMDMDILHEDKRDDFWRMVIKFVNQNFNLLTDGEHFLGAWIDQASGMLWIDVSQIFHVRQYAEMIGKDRNEIAIWDVDKGEEIRFVTTEPNGKE